MLSIVFMNKRSILTAVLALGLGVTALTGCSDNTGANYVTPSNVETIQNTIAELGDQGVKVPEKRDLKIKLAESDKAAKWKIEVSDPTALEVGKSEKNVVTLHPLRALGEEDDPVTVSLTDPDGITTDFKVTVTEGANGSGTIDTDLVRARDRRNPGPSHIDTQSGCLTEHR